MNFYKYTFQVFMFCFFMSCSSNSSKEYPLTGNWNTCARDGSYIELFFNDSTFRFATAYGLMTEWSKYEIHNDTLIQFNKLLGLSSKDTIIEAKAIISKTSTNKLTLTYITSNEIWDLNRIEQEIDTNNHLGILMGVWNRSNKTNCPDIRSTEEKTEDSLNAIIEFQF